MDGARVPGQVTEAGSVVNLHWKFDFTEEGIADSLGLAFPNNPVWDPVYIWTIEIPLNVTPVWPTCGNALALSTRLPAFFASCQTPTPPPSFLL